MKLKTDFANYMSDSVSLGMSACERYGMTWGCDIDCLILRTGDCENEEENRHLLQEIEKELKDET